MKKRSEIKKKEIEIKRAAKRQKTFLQRFCFETRKDFERQVNKEGQ